MYIEAADGSWIYGYATAEDCGGGIKGDKIDLFFDTYDECIQFGVRKAVVYILE
jgi:3D (Asp-Asp-Asp) domain-containing protein